MGEYGNSRRKPWYDLVLTSENSRFTPHLHHLRLIWKETAGCLMHLAVFIICTSQKLD